MGMDRREFIKAFSIVAAAAMLGGCRKLPLFGGDAKDLPSMARFEKEVVAAMKLPHKALKLVPVDAATFEGSECVSRKSFWNGYRFGCLQWLR